MDTPPKAVGQSLRRMFASMIRRPMGWTMIDAFAKLEEREETAANNQSPSDRATPDDNRRNER